jgi:ATP-dependent exoDNAse (exonuclease V) alpha subunit
MCRTQFPLRLAYCTTVNKSQGQEYDTVLIDLRKEPFAHGHLYVALSRVKYADKLTILINENQRRITDVSDVHPMVDNIIYPELLLNVSK